MGHGCFWLSGGTVVVALRDEPVLLCSCTIHNFVIPSCREFTGLQWFAYDSFGYHIAFNAVHLKIIACFACWSYRQR
ncbi:uncharacterized protein K452DRAFT_291457, partial [Aplosporella prunicola CBS 121167]